MKSFQFLHVGKTLSTIHIIGFTVMSASCCFDLYDIQYVYYKIQKVYIKHFKDNVIINKRRLPAAKQSGSIQCSRNYIILGPMYLVSCNINVQLQHSGSDIIFMQRFVPIFVQNT